VYEEVEDRFVLFCFVGEDRLRICWVVKSCRGGERCLRL
jgi:hypothetical protein